MANEYVQDTYERIDRLLTQAEPRIARVFAAAILQLRESLDLDLVAALIQQGRMEELLDLLRDTSAQLASISSVVFADAGRDTADFLRTADLARIVFDVVNVRAVEQMQANQLRLIREFTDGQRDVLRQVMTDGITEGVNPIEQARRFRDVVGLTDRQAAAVSNYRRLLGQVGRSDYSLSQQRENLTRALRDGRGDRTVESAIRRGKPIPQERIDWLVKRYSERYIKHRAEVIGRTEALRSVHQGSEQAYEQAIAEGQIDREDITEQWNSARDRRVRDSHRMLNGQTKGVGGFWQGLWGRLRYPGDPQAPAKEVIQCRCIVTRTIRRRPSDTL